MSNKQIQEGTPTENVAAYCLVEKEVREDGEVWAKQHAKELIERNKKIRVYKKVGEKKRYIRDFKFALDFPKLGKEVPKGGFY